jgi:hypothetical protein
MTGRLSPVDGIFRRISESAGAMAGSKKMEALTPIPALSSSRRFHCIMPLASYKTTGFTGAVVLKLFGRLGAVTK